MNNNRIGAQVTEESQKSGLNAEGQALQAFIFEVVETFRAAATPSEFALGRMDMQASLRARGMTGGAQPFWHIRRSCSECPGMDSETFHVREMIREMVGSFGRALGPEKYQSIKNQLRDLAAARGCARYIAEVDPFWCRRLEQLWN